MIQDKAADTPTEQATQKDIKLKSERDKQIYEAKQKYGIEFFKNFAFSGPEASQLSQKALEEYIINQEDPKEIQNLIISITNSAYELNSLIPNIDLLFYNLFCSPLTTKE